MAILAAAPGVRADDDDEKQTYILATGRRLPLMYAISLKEALKPANNNTPNAIVSRSLTSLPHFDGRLVGDPANIAVSEDGKTAYIINHHGSIDNAEYRQHGGRGQIAIMDVGEMLKPKNDMTAKALDLLFDSGHFGAVGILLLPETMVIGNAENHLTEDGGNRITFVDRKTGSLRHQVELALGDPGFQCPDYPVPFFSPHGPPSPQVAVLSPHPTWGCFPDTNGLAMGTASDGKRYIFGANGGTDDVSVIDLDAALAGDKLAETCRIPTQIGPWGITSTPDGRYIIAANRESQQFAFEGNTISIIDVDRAAACAPDAEVARVLVGTSNPNTQTRPFIPSVTPDGREIIVPNFRSGNLSIVDLQKALDGDADAEVARIPLVKPPDPDGALRPSRPKGSAITSDGRYAIISGGPSVRPHSILTGAIFVVDLTTRQHVATITGVGNDPYGLALVER